MPNLHEEEQTLGAIGAQVVGAFPAKPGGTFAAFATSAEGLSRGKSRPTTRAKTAKAQVLTLLHIHKVFPHFQNAQLGQPHCTAKCPANGPAIGPHFPVHSPRAVPQCQVAGSAEFPGHRVGTQCVAAACQSPSAVPWPVGARGNLCRRNGSRPTPLALCKAVGRVGISPSVWGQWGLTRASQRGKTCCIMEAGVPAESPNGCCSNC